MCVCEGAVCASVVRLVWVVVWIEWIGWVVVVSDWIGLELNW